ncbi:MAG: response regulator transcription factor [Anaerolineaceae bacterium]|nr:response regulator transcription factor [Anaerolineaceae bacterium]
MAKILIIEDEVELTKVLKSYLKRENHEVVIALRGDDGLSLWEDETPDLVLLDLNLPGMDGLDVAMAIRRKSDTPIIMLTARVEESDRLAGLDFGADDYVTKPYSPREVVARVRAVLRRSGKGSQEKVSYIKVKDIEIDMDAYEVKRAGELIDLTSTELNLLVLFSSNPGRVFSRLQLLEATQGTAYEGYERTIDAHIKNLRAKIEVNSKKPAYILTVFGVGYKFAKE